jgi:[ribosomal protein S5]-alanine N-acetyltransferase
MSSKDLNLICRPFKYDDYDSYLWAHQNQLPSQHPFDEGYFPTHGITLKYFKSLVDEYEGLSDDHHAFVLGVFDSSNSLLGIGELISLNDDASLVQIKIKVFNLYFNRGIEHEIVNQLTELAREKQFKKLVAYVSLQDEKSIKLFKDSGLNDDGVQMIAECDQVCWPTKHVFSIEL